MAVSPRQFVAAWLSRKKVTIDERGTLVSPDKKNYHGLFKAMWLDYKEQMKSEAFELGKKPFFDTETDINKALDELIENEILQRLAVITAGLACEIESNSLMRKFVLALTGKEDALVICVMSHWLWLVKRKMNDLPVVHQLMPILYGPQGAGKSVALQHLLSPIANLTLELSLTEITDPRFYFALNANFVAILDEMAGAKRADVEALKKQVTAIYNDARKLGTNMVIKIKQNSSLIGTTNKPVGELIYDTTGARRFFQVDVPPKVDWDAINTIDYTALFKGINEKRARGYIEELLPDMLKAQEKLVGKDELTAFLEHYQIDPLARGVDRLKDIACGDLYALYQSWCETNGVSKPINSIWFGRKLGPMGIEFGTKSAGGKSHRTYLINKESTVHAKTYDSLEASMPRIGKA